MPLGVIGPLHALRARGCELSWLGRRADLTVPLAFSAVLVGVALFLLVLVDAPRVALAVVILALVIVLAVLRELIFIGDR